MNCYTWGLIRETHDVSTPRELKSHVDYGVLSPAVGQPQWGDTASGSQKLEASRGSCRASDRSRFVYWVQQLKELYEQVLEDICKEDE